MIQSSLLNNSGAASNPNSAVPTGAAATSDMFTKLLVAQIQNQDPTAPTDPSTFVNQLATLSQTESLQNMTDMTSANASILQSLQVLAMGAQVGSTLTATSTSVNLDSSPVSGSVTFPNGTAKAHLVLTGSDKQTHTIDLGAQDAGTVPFTIDPAALGLAPGTYSMSVEDDASDSPPVQITGTLSSVQLSAAGAVTLVVSNLGDVSPSAVTGFSGPSNTTPH